MEAQEEKLRQEILAESTNRAERIIARANRDAAAALKRAESANQRRRTEQLQRVEQESAQRAQSIIRGAWTEKRNQWLQRREAGITQLLQRVLQRAEALSPASSERQESMKHLAAEALSVMLPAAELVVRVAPADKALVTSEWLTALCPEGSAIPAFVIEESTALAGGIQLSTPNGSRVFDNSYRGRLARMNQEFRRDLAAAIPEEVATPLH